MAKFSLQWAPHAYHQLRELLSGDERSFQAVVDLALALAEDPAAAGGTPTGLGEYQAASAGGVFVVYVLTHATDTLRVVGFGHTA